LRYWIYGFISINEEYSHWQVNNLLQVAQKCQSTHADGGSDGVSAQDLQTNSSM